MWVAGGPLSQLRCRKQVVPRRTAPHGAVRRPFPVGFHFAKSIRNDGRRTHGEDSTLRARACEDSCVVSRDRWRRDSGERQAAQEGAAEVPGLRPQVRLPRPRAHQAVEGDGPGQVEVLPRVPAGTGQVPRARRARRAGAPRSRSRRTDRQETLICFLSVRPDTPRTAHGQGTGSESPCPLSVGDHDPRAAGPPRLVEALRGTGVTVTEGHGIPASLTPSSRDRCHTPSCTGFPVTGNRDGEHAGKAAHLRVTRLRSGLVGG